MSKVSLVALACVGVCAFSPGFAVAESDPALSFDGKLPATLAAGSEVFRAYESGAVLLQLRSNPVFGAAPEDWPVVQVGPLALAFMREGGNGRIGILRGEEAELLPDEFALDSDGRASAAIEAIMAFDASSGTAVHAIGGKIVVLEASARGRAVEVALAAGASAAWPVDGMEVLVVGEEQGRPPGGAPPGDSAAALLDRVLAALRAPVASALPHASGSSSEPAKAERKPLPPGYVRLEISTPPAVRRGAGQVRAIVARSLNP